MVDASLRATILESLYRLRTDLGISLIYVTHDLTTAYQISDDVVVLYGGKSRRGRRRRSGDPAPRASLYAGTDRRDSAARPGSALGTAGSRWATRGHGAGDRGARAVPLLNRCPYVMPFCRTQVPPLFQTSTGRRTACHLYAPTKVDVSIAGTGVSKVPA